VYKNQVILTRETAMQAIKKFNSWFSKQKLVIKFLVSIFILLFLCVLCSIPAAIFSPSTPSPAVNETSVADLESTQPPVSTEIPVDVATIAPTDTRLPTSTPLPTETRIPSPTPFPTDTPNPNLIQTGTYMVNTDIKPGIYKGFAGEGIFSSCYWERLKDLTGSFDSIIANSNSIGQFYIEVKDSDYALRTDCQLIWLETIPEHTGEYPSILEAGTYLIGSDIQPGTYRGQAGSDIMESCYWERLRSVSGDFDSILANDNATGQFYVQVLPSDFALNTACELEWIGE
jgi:hypothetical protein